MKIINNKSGLQESHQLKNIEKDTPSKIAPDEAYSMLEQGVQAALESYSNVHRGSGHNSIVTTHLFEQARDIILESLGLNKHRYVVIFCTPLRAATLIKQIGPESFHVVSSREIGLELGLRALAVKKTALPGGAPFQAGGGTTKLVSKDWVVWADAPDKFEAGTPAIINIIAFARALQLVRQNGKDVFKGLISEKLSATEILYHDELEKYSRRELLDELRKTLIGRGVCVPTAEGTRPFINLDNSASTPTFTPIWNAFRKAWRQAGQEKQEIIHEVKSICASVLGAPKADFDVIFTSNTTEAINLVAESLSREPKENLQTVVLSTLLEHSSNDLPWRIFQDFSIIRLSVDPEGFVDQKEMEAILSAYNQKGHYGNRRIRLVAVSGASNVLGTCNNLEVISRIAHQYGTRLLVDAAQLVAHRKVNMEGSGIDYLAFSAHKVYAPFGCGVLVVRKGLLNFNSPELEMIRSSGEENLGGIAAVGKALVFLQRIGMDLIQEEEQSLTALALQGMAKIDGLRIYGIKDPGSPAFARRIGVIAFGLKSILPGLVAGELAEQGGIGVRYGCHCAHIIIKHILNVSPSLERFQKLIQTLFPKLRFPGVVRISLGIENSKEDVDRLINVLGKIATQRNSKTGWNSTSSHKGVAKLSQKDMQRQMKDFVRDSALRVYSSP
jgi:selenocysteine lyase/cysteine desulfurase